MPFLRMLLPILLLAPVVPDVECGALAPPWFSSPNFRFSTTGLSSRVSLDDSDGPAVRDLKLRLVEQINHDRAAAGARPVEFSDELSTAADAHCREMLKENYTSHWNLDGWKPYMRYSAAGIRDFTEENIFSLWSSKLETTPASLWREVLRGHRGFLAETPPNDGHRRSILSARQTHVGIGLAFDKHGMRMIEVFGARYAQLKALPARATLRDKLIVDGRLANLKLRLIGVAIYFEPLPKDMSHKALRETYAYSLPEEYQMQRPWLGNAEYRDGTQGSVYLGDGGKFSLGLPFWKKLPGVYTVGVWVSDDGGRHTFLAALQSVFVEAGKK